jgi:hypothetical protein
LEHGELVAEDQDLDVLGGLGSGAQHDPAHELGDHLVDQSPSADHAHHLPRTNGQVTGCVHSFGHPQARRAGRSNRERRDATGTGSVASVRPAELDEAPQLSDDELVGAVRRWASDEGALPSRERIRVRFGIGTGRADRVRAAALTGQTDERAAVGSA